MTPTLERYAPRTLVFSSFKIWLAFQFCPTPSWTFSSEVGCYLSSGRNPSRLREVLRGIVHFWLTLLPPAKVNLLGWTILYQAPATFLDSAHIHINISNIHYARHDVTMVNQDQFLNVIQFALDRKKTRSRITIFNLISKIKTRLYLPFLF